MQPEILGRIFKGFGANAYGQMVTVVVQLLGVPILLHAWGSQLYGEWLLLFAIPAYLSMADLGFSQSAANDITARLARADRAGALAVFQSLALLVYTIAGVGLVLITILVPYIPVHDWLHFEAMDANAARWVLWLLAGEIFVGLPDGVNHAGFRAVGDYAFHYSLYSTMRLLQAVIVWLAVLGGGSPIIAAAILFGTRAVATLTFAVILARRHRWLQLGFVYARTTELRCLLRPALANVAFPAAQALNIQGMVLAIGAVLGPLAVVAFSTLRTLTRSVLQLVLTVAHASEPELAAAHGAANRPLMRTLFVYCLRAGLWLAVVAATALAVFGDAILDVWAHGKVPMNGVLFAWLLGSAVATALWYGALIVLKAANRHLRAAAVYLFVSAATILLAALALGVTGDLADAGLVVFVLDVVMVTYTLKAAAPLLNLRPLTGILMAANPLPLLHLLRGKLLVR